MFNVLNLLILIKQIKKVKHENASPSILVAWLGLGLGSFASRESPLKSQAQILVEFVESLIESVESLEERAVPCRGCAGRCCPGLPGPARARPGAASWMQRRGALGLASYASDGIL